MSNKTDQLTPPSQVPIDGSMLILPFNGSSFKNLNTNVSSSSSPHPPPPSPYGKAPPPDNNNQPSPPSPSPSPPPTAKYPSPPIGASKVKSPSPDNSPPAPSLDDSPPPPPPLEPPPSPSPSNSTSPSQSSNNPPPSQGPPPPSSPPPPLQTPPPPSPPQTQNASPTFPSSNQSPPPLQTSPTLPSPPAPAVSSPQNVSGIITEAPSPINSSLVEAAPAVPGVGYPPLPPLTETSPSTYTPPAPPTNTENSTHPGPPSGNTTGNSTSVTKPNSDSASTSSAKHLSDSGGLVRGAVVGITLAGVAVIVVAIFFLVSRRKKKRSECLAIHYVPTHGYSMNPDGYYYAQTTPMGNSSRFTSQPPFPSVTPTYGSFHDHLSCSGSPEVVGLGNSKSYFTYEEITEMTNGFSRQNLLGEGGFGCVYKGLLTDGRAVAVKQLKHGGGQGEREFRAEVEIISRVHHRHLVSLVGYCIADNHRSLVYEFLPNKTLEYHLHGKGLPVMEWSKRLRIAIGAARGLAYLHDDCHPKIIHRDIKTANILLDETFDAQVADFGLARLTNDTHTHVSTRVVGTFGYMAPEYASSGKLTDKSDVFSFGVVLLELITGRKPVDTSQPLGEESLVEWARPLLVDALESGNLDVVVDRRLDGNYSKSEMYRMMEAAASCVRHSAAKRPRMVQVLRALDTVGELSDLSNGLKFGQSTVFDSRQYSADIQQFRRMAFGSDSYISDRSYTEEFDSNSMVQSREYSSPESLCRPLNSRGHNLGEYHNSYEFSSNSLGRRPGGESYESSRYKGQGLR